MKKMSILRVQMFNFALTSIKYSNMARIKTEKNLSRKDVIVSKAATLFREKGYKAASMRDLAEAVGVEAASLYNHIKSKSELLHELVFSVANKFVIKVDEIESEPISSLQKMEKILRPQFLMPINRCTTNIQPRQPGLACIYMETG